MIDADALALILKHWRAILSGVLAASLLTWALVERSSARHWQKVAQVNADAASLANQKLAVSNASINTLQTALADKNAESEARAKAYADSKAKDTATIAEQDRRFKTTQQAIDALKAVAGVPDKTGACKVPSAVAAALEDL